MARARHPLGLSLSLAALFACPGAPIDEARRLETAGERAAAAERYQAVARADPANLAAWDAAVRLWCRELARIDRCVGLLELELELLGDLARHREALGEALEARGRRRLEAGLVDAAIGDLERAEKAAPRRASVHAAFARVAITRGDREAALQALDRARRLDPKLDELETLTEALPTEEGFGGEGAAEP